jgi:hypothetical protein
MLMGRARQFAIFAIVAVVAAAAGYGGWRVYQRTQPEQCYACQRPIHAHSRTVASAKGSSRIFCCPACALSEQRQEARDVRVTELTAYLSGAKLSPNDAYVVKGSDVNMCAHAHELIDADKRPADVQYDRCAPSLLAFAQQGEAIQFSREHGGTVHPFREVAASYAK